MPILPDPRRELFALQVARGANQSKAYAMAGYEPSDSNASALAQLPDVANRIAEIRGIASARAQVTTDRVIAELARIGFADITQMVSIERGRLKIKDTAQVSPDLRAAIAEITKGREGIRVKLHDKRAALELLGKHLGLFKENVDLTVNVSLADLVNGSYELDKPPAVIEGEAKQVDASPMLPDAQGE